MTREKVVFTWSGGKDSAMALYELRKNPGYEILGLLTTVTKDYDRVSMHGVRSLLLKKQAEHLGLPLDIMTIDKDSPNEAYEAGIKEKLLGYRDKGVLSVGFGDIYLEGIREYREKNVGKVGMKAVFPIWDKDTKKLAQYFINSGFKSIITCVDSQKIDKKFAGMEFDEKFLSELPDSADPCGENGEFHSFVYDGPIFKQKVPCVKGEVVLRDDRFYYCDLLSA